MANRIEHEDVTAVVETDIVDVTSFITTANILIDKLLSSSGLAEIHLAEIEKYLAAHFVAVTDPRVVSEKIGEAEKRFTTGANTYSNSMKEASGLNETIFGKQVLLLDTTGILRQKLGKASASFEVMG